MTPEQLQLVRDSWAALEDRSELVGARFQHHLFASQPELRALFPADVDRLAGIFAAELGVLVAVVTDLDAFLERSAALGVRHAGYGVRASHYRASRDALLAAIDEVTDDPDGRAGDGRSDVLGAWAAVHDLVVETMMAGALGAGHR
ncbi:MAG TPA: globin domain-containing protein [Aquihabitans sp.]|jgi:nitric oxide dioxygenase|nr:globin domain-containing protein [Aquihabitans sp.]